MATVTLKGNQIHTIGIYHKWGFSAPKFEPTKKRIIYATLPIIKGKKSSAELFPKHRYWNMCTICTPN